MKPSRVVGVGLACFVAGALAQAGSAQARKPSFSPDLIQGKDAKVAVYEEAGEWDKAKASFDRALALNADDDSGMIEYGALANLHNDRSAAEALFEKALKKKPREFWHWVGAGASYLGVRPE